MAILNTNQVTLSDSGLTLDSTVISCHTSEISNNSLESVKIRAQVGAFLNVEKMLASPTNALKIDGLTDAVMIFDYPVTDRNVFYYFDLKLKAYLMDKFPMWDENKLIITTAE